MQSMETTRSVRAAWPAGQERQVGSVNANGGVGYFTESTTTAESVSTATIASTKYPLPRKKWCLRAVFEPVKWY